MYVYWYFIGKVYCETVSSINKTDRHDTIEILLTVALNTITLTSNPIL